MTTKDLPKVPAGVETLPGQVFIKPDPKAINTSTIEAVQLDMPAFLPGYVLMGDPLDKESEVKRGDLVMFVLAASTAIRFEGAEFLTVPRAHVHAIIDS